MKKEEGTGKLQNYDKKAHLLRSNQNFSEKNHSRVWLLGSGFAKTVYVLKQLKKHNTTINIIYKYYPPLWNVTFNTVNYLFWTQSDFSNNKLLITLCFVIYEYMTEVIEEGNTLI